MKVALVHDYLREYGGAERVLEVLHEIFPDAPLYTAYCSFESLGIHAQRFKNWDIHASWLQNLPFANRLISPFRIFAPMIFESFDLSEYDLVISSSAVYFAKGVITKPSALHLSYIHTPPRYLYGYTSSYNYKKKKLVRFLAGLINFPLRVWDFYLSQRPDILIANSQNVAARIKKFYRRDSVVIYPPVDLSAFAKVKKENRGYFLALGRLDRGKRLDLIINACTKLQLKVKIAGAGRELNNLKSLSSENVEFLGPVTDNQRVDLFAGATALLLASEDEDFGITAVEAQAAGTPVIALRAGGYLETIREGKTGEFFNQPTVESLVMVLSSFHPEKYNEEICRRNAARFSKEIFTKRIKDLIAKKSRA